MRDMLLLLICVFGYFYVVYRLDKGPR